MSRDDRGLTHIHLPIGGGLWQALQRMILQLLGLLASGIARSTLRYPPTEGQVDPKLSGTAVVEPVAHHFNDAWLSDLQSLLAQLLPASISVSVIQLPFFRRST